jgi:excisionase family DNA binding protein
MSALAVTLSDSQLDELADRVATRLVAIQQDGDDDRWLDVRAAAEHLAVHPDTVRREAASGRLDSAQDGPGCKLYFRRSELDRWRQETGR